MAKARISQHWQDDIVARINAINPACIDDSVGPKFKEYTTTNSLALQFIVMRLAAKNISFKVLNLGAGVKKITTEVDTCPKCHGTGKC